MEAKKSITIALVGNPNCGKTSLFNNLTGSNQKIGNWSGVTVEKKIGKFHHNGTDIEVVDLPGIYSLSTRSLDERIARDYICGNHLYSGIMERKHHQLHNRRHRIITRMGRHNLDSEEGQEYKVFNRQIQHRRIRRRHIWGKGDRCDVAEEQNVNFPDIIVNIVDASNFERNMYLTLQLLEMKIPMIIALNMIDVAKEKNIKIDIHKLSEKLGVPVVEVVASTDKGTEKLKDIIANGKIGLNNISEFYDKDVEQTINKLQDLTKGIANHYNISPRCLAINLLEKNNHLISRITKEYPEKLSKIKEIINELETKNSEKEDSEILIADGRYTFIKEISDYALSKKDEFTKTTSDKIDKIVLNRFLGIPIFLIVLYMLFWISTEVAGAGIDFIDALFNGGQLMYWEVTGIIPLFQGIIGEGSWIDIILLQGVLGGVGAVLSFIPILFLVFLILTFLEDWGYMSRAATVMDRFMRLIGLPGKAFISFMLGFGCTVPAVMSARTLEDKDERWLTIMLVPFMSCGARLPVYVFFGAVFFNAWGGTLIFLLYLIGIVVAILVGLVLKRWKMKNKPVSTFIIELPSYHIPSIRNVLITVWLRIKSFIKSAGVIITTITLILTIMANIQLYKPTYADDTYVFEAASKESLLGVIGEGTGFVFRPLRFGIVQNGENAGDTNWHAGLSVFTGLFAKEAIVGTLGSLEKNLDEAFSPFSAFLFLLFILLYTPCIAVISATYRELGTKWAIFQAVGLFILAYAIVLIVSLGVGIFIGF